MDGSICYCAKNDYTKTSFYKFLPPAAIVLLVGIFFTVSAELEELVGAGYYFAKLVKFVPKHFNIVTDCCVFYS
jgi:hypothetical protein